jgi:hypothetical protein
VTDSLYTSENRCIPDWPRLNEMVIFGREALPLVR